MISALSVSQEALREQMKESVSVFYYGKKCYRQWEWFSSKPFTRRDLPSPVSSCSYVHPIKPQRFFLGTQHPHHRVPYDQSVQCCTWQPAWNCVSRAGTENKPGAVEFFKKRPNTNISEINWFGWNVSKEITLILRLNMRRSSPNGLSWPTLREVNIVV